MEIKKYFMIGSEEWKTTVRFCLRLGFTAGLVFGVFYILFSQ